MLDPIITDVFKFVAVRPAQRVLDGGDPVGFISDGRLSNPDGRGYLKDLGLSLVPSSVAMQRYQGLDLSRLARLADKYHDLLNIYESPSSNAPTEPQKALEKVGLSSLNNAEQNQLTNAAWDALYTAYRTGPDAGPRLEIPMAELRILNFISLTVSQNLQGTDAETALHAMPLIPAQIFDVQPPALPSSPVSPTVSVDSNPAISRMRGLIDDYVLTSDLMRTLRSNNIPSSKRIAPALPSTTDAPPTTTDAPVRNSPDTVTVTTTPRVVDLIPTSLEHQTKRLFSKLAISSATSIPAAMQVLKGHLASLTLQAYGMRNDPTFVKLLTNFASSTNTDLVSVVPGGGLISGDDPSTVPDVDVTGRIKPVGIGDLKVVKQTLIAYVPGEVAHIENVLKGESKQRVYRTLDRTETTVLTSEETVEETDKDTQTTDRFELKKEAEQTIKDDMSLQAGVTVTGAYGPVTVTAHGDFAYSTSQTDSVRSSSNFARDVVDRSVSKVQKTIKTEQTTKTFHETEETDTHGLDNSQGAGNVSGIYRWVDKKYRAQVYNYGRRLMFEFVVPDPAAYFRASQNTRPAPPPDATPPEPFVDLLGRPLTAKQVDDSNYAIFASRYNADVTPAPSEYAYVATAFEQNSVDDGHSISKAVKDIVIPEGYTRKSYDAQVSLIWGKDQHPQFYIQIADDRYHLEDNTGAKKGTDYGEGSTSSGYQPQGGDKGLAIQLSVVGFDINAFAVNASVVCLRNPETYEKWQIQTFSKIFAAYQAMKTDYDQKVTQAQAQVNGVLIEGQNPSINLQIVKTELKKLCLTMLTGQHFNSFNAMSDPPDIPTHLPEMDVYEALDEGPIIQFFEDAFDWDQITYLFFPYFWGRKSNWLTKSNLSDPDPLFMQFREAGAARVLVPVAPHYERAVLYFLQSKSPNIKDKIWQGGEPPTIDDPLFKSIADEIRGQTDDLAGAKPEGEPWEFTIPTTLVWLQGDSQLPTFN